MVSEDRGTQRTLKQNRERAFIHPGQVGEVQGDGGAMQRERKPSRMFNLGASGEEPHAGGGSLYCDPQYPMAITLEIGGSVGAVGQKGHESIRKSPNPSSDGP